MFLFIMCLDVIVLTNLLYLKWFCRYLVRVLETDMREQQPPNKKVIHTYLSIK